MEVGVQQAQEIESPKRIATEAFMDAAAAVARLDQIYERNTAFLRERCEAYLRGEALPARVRATYPFVRIATTTYARVEIPGWPTASSPAPACTRPQ
jgi:AMP nucleosidase